MELPLLPVLAFIASILYISNAAGESAPKTETKKLPVFYYHSQSSSQVVERSQKGCCHYSHSLKKNILIQLGQTACVDYKPIVCVIGEFGFLRKFPNHTHTCTLDNVEQQGCDVCLYKGKPYKYGSVIEKEVTPTTYKLVQCFQYGYVRTITGDCVNRATKVQKMMCSNFLPPILRPRPRPRPRPTPRPGKPSRKPQPPTAGPGKPSRKPQPPTPRPGKPSVKPQPPTPRPGKPSVKPPPATAGPGKPQGKPRSGDDGMDRIMEWILDP